MSKQTKKKNPRISKKKKKKTTINKSVRKVTKRSTPTKKQKKGNPSKSIRKKKKKKILKNLELLPFELLCIITNYFSSPTSVFSLMLVSKEIFKFFCHSHKEIWHNGCEKINFNVIYRNVFARKYNKISHSTALNFVKRMSLLSNELGESFKLKVDKFKVFPMVKHLSIGCNVNISELNHLKYLESLELVPKKRVNDVDIRNSFSKAIGRKKVKGFLENLKFFKIENIDMNYTSKYFKDFIMSLHKLEEFSYVFDGCDKVNRFGLEIFVNCKNLKKIYINYYFGATKFNLIPDNSSFALSLEDLNLIYSRSFGFIGAKTTKLSNFKKFPNLKRFTCNGLEIDDVISLKKLKYFKVSILREFKDVTKTFEKLFSQNSQLEEVLITYYFPFKLNFSFMSYFKALKKLELSGPDESTKIPLENILPEEIQFFQHLEEISFRRIDFQNFNLINLTKFKNLKAINFNDCDKRNDIFWEDKFPELFNGVTNKIIKFDFVCRHLYNPDYKSEYVFKINNFKFLERIELHDVFSLVSLKNLDFLKHVVLEKCLGIKSIELKSLKYLYSNRSIRLKKIIADKLEELHLRTYEYEAIKIAQVESKSLKKLVIKNHSFSKTGFVKCTSMFKKSLEHLEIIPSGKAKLLVTDSFIQRFVNMKVLKMSNCSVIKGSCFGFLKKLISLKIKNCEGFEVKNFKKLKGLKKFQKIKVVFDIGKSSMRKNILDIFGKDRTQVYYNGKLIKQ